MTRGTQLYHPYGLSVPLFRCGGFSFVSATSGVLVEVGHDLFYVFASCLEVDAPTIHFLDAICSSILIVFEVCVCVLHIVIYIFK